jgi:hypothetical protein
MMPPLPIVKPKKVRNKRALREGLLVRSAIEEILRDHASRSPLARQPRVTEITRRLPPDLRRSVPRINEVLRHIYEANKPKE